MPLIMQNDMHFVSLEALTMLVNNMTNILLIKNV